MTGRIVLLTSGSFGDVNPFVGLALELKSRGYDALIVSTPAWRQWIEGHGVEAATFEHGWDVIAPSQRLTDCLDPSFLASRVWESYRELVRILRQGDVLVCLTMLGLPPLVAAPLVAEAAGIPWIAVVLEPISFFPASERLSTSDQGSPLQTSALFSPNVTLLSQMSVGVHFLRSHLGLPAVAQPCIADFTRADMILALFSGVLAPPQPSWPSHTKLTGFVWFDGYSDEPAQGRVEEFVSSGSPPIVFTLSSDALFVPDPDFAAKCVFASRSLGRRAVIAGLALPPGAEAIGPNDISDVCFVRSASFKTLFPRAAAVVHHGGIGTTALAMRAGAPMLVMPGDYAQPDIAARVQGLGMARVIPRAAFTGPAAAAELFPLLADPRYRQAAERVALQLSEENGARNAGDAIEELVEKRLAKLSPQPA